MTVIVGVYGGFVFGYLLRSWFIGAPIVEHEVVYVRETVIIAVDEMGIEHAIRPVKSMSAASSN